MGLRPTDKGRKVLEPTCARSFLVAAVDGKTLGKNDFLESPVQTTGLSRPRQEGIHLHALNTPLKQSSFKDPWRPKARIIANTGVETERMTEG